jgi:hypothetical protein
MSNPMQLRPEEWKQNVLLNLAQLQNYIASIPGTLENGAAGISLDNLTIADEQMDRTRTFMRAWQRSRFEVPQAGEKPAAAAGNGTEPAKRKGGWQKGRPRKPKPAQEAAQ